jgi:cation:H+ antiporter
MSEVFILFGVSLLFLILSANFLLKFVERLASKIRISPLIIGTTLIAIGTSLPETSVAISSISQNIPSISFGDIIGSNIANVSLILGIGILFFPIRIGTEKTQKNNLVLLLVTIAFVVLQFLPQTIRHSFGILLLVFYIVFLIIEIIWGKIGSLHEDKKAIGKMQKERGNPILLLFGVIVSLIGIIFSSKYLVSSAVTISKVLGVSAEVIGLSVIALGTSLPELATTIASGIKKDWKLLYGDIQGSNIYNLSVIGAILMTFSKSDYAIDLFSLCFMAATTVAIIFLSYKYEGRTIPRFFGLLFLGSYVFYIIRIY